MSSLDDSPRAPSTPLARRKPDPTRHPLILDGLAVTFYLVFKEPAGFSGVFRLRGHPNPTRSPLANRPVGLFLRNLPILSNRHRRVKHFRALPCDLFRPVSKGVPRQHQAERLGRASAGRGVARDVSQQRQSNPPILRNHHDAVNHFSQARKNRSGPGHRQPTKPPGQSLEHFPEALQDASPRGEPVEYTRPSRGCQERGASALGLRGSGAEPAPEG